VGVLTRLNVLSKWARSLLLSATTGYGEQPYRVVGASLLTILGFGLLYRSSSIPTSDPTGIDTLTFSFQSFVSFVLGPPETTSVFIRGLSAVEGFVGAFFIGLFVFTLTRRVHR
jgi:hypothetical protein